MNAVEIQGLTKRYGAITAVDSLDLTVRQGELFALLGVNGAGKTTTIKMLSCLTRPDGGDARLLGRSIVSDAAGVKRCIGVSPQETAVAPNLTARENLALLCGVHGLSRQETAARTEELSRALGLEAVPVETAEQAKAALHRMAKEDYAVIYLTETFAADMSAEIEHYKDELKPAIILIPGRQGSLGIGKANLRKAVERAVGADIL